MPERATARGRAEGSRHAHPEQVQSYRRDGYLVVENVLSSSWRPRQVTDELVEASRAVTEQYRRLRSARPHVPGAARPPDQGTAQRASGLPGHRVQQDDGHPDPADRPSGIRYQTASQHEGGGYGAAVEWHQDWAFYPHTNDDLLAIGIYLDDCGPDNGPLMVIPEATGGRSSTTTAAACSAPSIRVPRASISPRP